MKGAAQLLDERRTLGRYELVARLGDGGMAEVFLACASDAFGVQKPAVVKTIHGHLAREQEFIDMLLDEARVAALIQHPNVVATYDLGRSHETYFIAMEYIAGQSLKNLMRAQAKSRSFLDVYATVQMIAKVADGLDAAHNLRSASGEPLELVHRDVSPGNIMVGYNGKAKLVDFGVAKSLGRVAKTRAGQIKGKLGYASPEQLEGRELDRRSDVFSLGIVLWEALTIRRLYLADTLAQTVTKILSNRPAPPSTHRPEIPAELDEICLRALASDPKDRYQSAGAMRDALQQLMRAANCHGERRRVAKYMVAAFSDWRAHEDQMMAGLCRAQKKLGTDADLANPATDPALFDGEPHTTLPRGEAASTGDLARTARWPWLIAAGAAVLIALAIPYAGSDPAPQTSAHVSAAEKALRAPAPAVALYERAESALADGDAKRAESLLRDALALDADHAPSVRELGLLEAERGDSRGAVGHLTQYLRLAPNAPDASTVRSLLRQLQRSRDK